jgi:hypothetical protein
VVSHSCETKWHHRKRGTREGNYDISIDMGAWKIAWLSVQRDVGSAVATMLQLQLQRSTNRSQAQQLTKMATTTARDETIRRIAPYVVCNQSRQCPRFLSPTCLVVLVYVVR